MIRCNRHSTVQCVCCPQRLTFLPPSQIVNRWLSLRLELLGIGIVFGAALFVSVLLPRNAGLAGLALTSALNLTGQMCHLHAPQVVHTDAVSSVETPCMGSSPRSAMLRGTWRSVL